MRIAMFSDCCALRLQETLGLPELPPLPTFDESNEVVNDTDTMREFMACSSAQPTHP